MDIKEIREQLTGDDLEKWVEKQLVRENNLAIQNKLAPDLTDD